MSWDFVTGNAQGQAAVSSWPFFVLLSVDQGARGGLGPGPRSVSDGGKGPGPPGGGVVVTGPISGVVIVGCTCGSVGGMGVRLSGGSTGFVPSMSHSTWPVERFTETASL